MYLASVTGFGGLALPTILLSGEVGDVDLERREIFVISACLLAVAAAQPFFKFGVERLRRDRGRPLAFLARRNGRKRQRLQKQWSEVERIWQDLNAAESLPQQEGVPTGHPHDGAYPSLSGQGNGPPTDPSQHDSERWDTTRKLNRLRRKLTDYPTDRNTIASNRIANVTLRGSELISEVYFVSPGEIMPYLVYLRRADTAIVRDLQVSERLSDAWIVTWFTGWSVAAFGYVAALSATISADSSRVLPGVVVAGVSGLVAAGAYTRGIDERARFYQLMRVALDFHRFDLYEALKLKAPKDAQDESEILEAISQSIADGSGMRHSHVMFDLVLAERRRRMVDDSDDRVPSIRIGNIHAQNVQIPLAFQNSVATATANVEKSTSPELSKVLSQLIAATEEMVAGDHPQLTAAEKEEAGENIEVLTKQATKDSPNGSLIAGAAEGLKNIAKKIGDAAAPVIGAVEAVLKVVGLVT